jgi:hypothetical protein
MNIVKFTISADVDLSEIEAWLEDNPSIVINGMTTINSCIVIIYT